MRQPAGDVRSPDARSETAAVVVPIRSFGVAKQRLSPVSDPAARRALMQDLASTALDACAPYPTAVVTSDLDVFDFVADRGVTLIDDPGSLDGAARRGQAWARDIDVDRVVVMHADLPFARDLHRLVEPGRARIAALVPDQRRDGTPLLSIPVDVTFAFAYGPGSFARHCLHAEAAGLAIDVVDDPNLGFDVDLPEDLRELRRRVGVARPRPAG
jgi:2-phospho-L-lactate guanylyltransferase